MLPRIRRRYIIVQQASTFPIVDAQAYAHRAYRLSTNIGRPSGLQDSLNHLVA